MLDRYHKEVVLAPSDEKVINRSSRHRAREALEGRCFFKLICGASYRNGDVIEQLSFIYSLAGAHAIDVAADPAAVWRARRGIEQAANRWEGMEPFVPPLIMVSIGSGHDPHFQTLGYDAHQCEVCPSCTVGCPFHVAFRAGQAGPAQLQNCIGCGHCLPLCRFGSLSLLPVDRSVDDLRHALKQCRDAGARALEIHTTGDLGELQHHWFLAQELAPWDLLAFSLTVPPAAIVALAEQVVALAGPEVVLQLDGRPISGRAGRASTLPALELVRALAEVRLPAYLQASGGTNDLTGHLAREMGLLLHGVGMGSFARTVLREGDERDRIDRARTLVASVSGRRIVPGNCKRLNAVC